MCPYELALKLHELGVNSESEFYFVKEVKGGGSKTESIAQNTMRYSYRKEGDLIPAYMSHELGEILPSMINISKSKIWDDWLQLTQYFPNKDIEYYEAAYVRYNAYDSPTEVYSGFGGQGRHRIPREDGGGDPGDSSGDAGRERAPCRRVYVYGQDGEHDGYRYLYIKGRG